MFRITHTLPLCAIATLGFALFSVPARAQSPSIDTVTFGNSASEQSHQFAQELSDTAASGGLGESARRLLPRDPISWDGGHVSFTMHVDPVKQNYFTVRLWGSESSPNRLILFCEGKQIGYRPLGDIETLDFGNDTPGLPNNGRFFYQTSPLPLSLTNSKTTLRFEIRSSGPIWVYGTNFDQYQKPMATPTRGIYRVYTHTDGCFVPPVDEKQGTAPVNPPVRSTPGPEVLDQVKARVNHELQSLLTSSKPLNQPQMQFMARAYSVTWTQAYQSSNAIDKIIKSLDQLFAAYRKDPKLAEADPATYNPDWFGLGPAGNVIRLLSEPLRPVLDTNIEDGQGKKITRRAAWSEMLVASRDWHLRHRRIYTNQTMIVDLNIYTANCGIAAIDPMHALPDGQLRHTLYQAIGLEPWLGSDTDHGPEMPLGDHYYQLTAKGLTRELGFVGYYGEVLDWVAQIYDATRPSPNAPGDPKIAAQLEKIAHARAVFRYPMLDPDGNRAMRAETIVGWRDTHYPGEVTYGERVSWDGSATYAAAATLDSESVGYAQQMFSDNQFFLSVQERMSEKNLRVTSGLLGVTDQYALLQAQSPSAKRLPMTLGQPDFVFSDEEDGVVAIKHGSKIFYASLYWRARNAINSLARVHEILPTFERIAVVAEDTHFEPSGQFYIRPDLINMGFNNGIFLKYPGDLHSAHAGEKLPIPKIPEGVKYTPGSESPYAGKADFYTLRYGQYLIAMNCTMDKTCSLTVPEDFAQARDLVSDTTLGKAQHTLTVKPSSTTVLYAEK